MTTCGQCGVKIEDTTRIDCAVCGAATLTALRETEVDLRSVTGVLPAVALEELELAAGDGAPEIETTHDAKLVRSFELGDDSRPQSAVLHRDTLLVLSIDHGDTLAVYRFGLDGGLLGTLGSIAIGDGVGNIADPAGIAIDGAERIYLLDAGGCTVTKIALDGALVTRFGPASLRYPRDLEAAHDGSMLIADAGNHRVVCWDPDGQLTMAIGPDLDDEEDGTAASGNGPGELDTPSGVTRDRERRIYVSDTNNHRIQIFDESGRFLSTFGCEGKAAGQLLFPTDIRVGRDGAVFVFDGHGRRVQKFRRDGTVAYAIPVNSGLHALASIAGDIDVDAEERIYVPLPVDRAVVCLRVTE